MKLKISDKVQFENWDWGEFDATGEAWLAHLDDMAKAVAKDISEVIQHQLTEDGVEAHVDMEMQGDERGPLMLAIVLPLTGKDDQLIAVECKLEELFWEDFALNKHVDGYREAVIQELRLMADRLGVGAVPC